MGFLEKKLREQYAIVLVDMKVGGRSVESAKKVLTKWTNLDPSHFHGCSLKELEVWCQAVQSKSSWSKRLLPTLAQLIQEKQHENAQETQQQSSKRQASLKFRSYNDLPARDLIVEAEEMQESEVAELLNWERENKNRASVVKALSEILLGSTSPTRSPTSAQRQNFGPNPFQEENDKVFKKGRGTIHERCIDCGAMNSIDFGLLSQIINRRQNSTRGKMNAWADRQLESGARMTGRFTAAEMSRANQMQLANQVTNGIPCASCGAPMIR